MWFFAQGMDVSSMFDSCKMVGKQCVSCALCTNTSHRSFTRLKDYLQIDKDYLWLKTTIYSLRLFLQNSELILDHMMHF